MSKGLMMLSERLVEAEQQAALALAKAQQDLKIFLEQQDALNQYRQIYHQQWTDRGLQGIGAQQNSQYHAFINKLEQAAKPIEIGSLHHALFIHIGAEKTAAQWFQFADHVFGNQICRFLPTLHYDFAVLRIQCDQNLLGSHGSGNILHDRRECCRSYDHAMCAL